MIKMSELSSKINDCLMQQLHKCRSGEDICRTYLPNNASTYENIALILTDGLTVYNDSRAEDVHKYHVYVGAHHIPQAWSTLIVRNSAEGRLIKIADVTKPNPCNRFMISTHSGNETYLMKYYEPSNYDFKPNYDFPVWQDYFMVADRKTLTRYGNYGWKYTIRPDGLAHLTALAVALDMEGRMDVGSGKIEVKFR